MARARLLYPCCHRHPSKSASGFAKQQKEVQRETRNWPVAARGSQAKFAVAAAGVAVAIAVAFFAAALRCGCCFGL